MAAPTDIKHIVITPGFYGGKPCKAAGGVVVWIDNSLDDHLSPETMIAIARSMVPAHRAP